MEAWRKDENASSFDKLTRGALVTIEGYFKPEEWHDKDGVKHNRIIFVANSFNPVEDTEEAPKKSAKAKSK